MLELGGCVAVLRVSVCKGLEVNETRDGDRLTFLPGASLWQSKSLSSRLMEHINSLLHILILRQLAAKRQIIQELA